MCDPVSMAGLALSVGGTALRNVASNTSEAARSRALLAEDMRQRQLQAQAAAVNAQSANRYNNFEGQRQERAGQLGDFFASGNAPARPMAPSSEPAATGIVAREEQGRRDAAHAFGDQQAHALGNLRSFGDVAGEIGRGVTRDTSALGQVNSAMRGSASVLPYELDAASHRGDQMRMFGDILSGLGRIGVSAGVGGGLGNMFRNGIPGLPAYGVPDFGNLGG